MDHSVAHVDAYWVKACSLIQNTNINLFPRRLAQYSPFGVVYYYQLVDRMLPRAMRRTLQRGSSEVFLLCEKFHQLENRSPVLLRNGNIGFFVKLLFTFHMLCYTSQ